MKVENFSNVGQIWKFALHFQRRNYERVNGHNGI